MLCLPDVLSTNTLTYITQEDFLPDGVEYIYPNPRSCPPQIPIHAYEENT